MAYSPLPVKTSTTGPKILTAVGVLMLIAALAVVGLVVRLFLSVLPTGIVGADGAPGPDAVGGTEVPGSVTLDLPASSAFAVYLARPSGSTGVQLSDTVSVTGPDGQEAFPGITPSGSVDVRGVSARDVYSFRTSDAGEYTVTAPELTDPDAVEWATIIVAPSKEVPAFFGGIFGTIAGVFVAIGLGGAGLIVTIIGAVWWYTRSKDRRRVEAGQHGAPGAGGPPGAPGLAGPPQGPPTGPPQGPIRGQQPGPWA